MSLRMSFVSVLCTIAIGGLAGCDKKPASPPREKSPTMGEPSPHGGMPGVPPGGMPSGGAMTAPAANAMRGTVAETMNSGGYTYARVNVAGKDVWAAGPEAALAVGSTVDLTGGALMTAFRSDTLNRTFDEIFFVSDWAGAPGGGSPHGMAGGGAATGMGGGDSPHGNPAAAGLAPGEQIEPVDGSQPIAQVFADKAALAGKQVAVHGKVVKFNGGIMGKNWLHLQDGTGSGATGDLIVTTQDSAAVGDIVLARGTLALDTDLGAGYRYDVLLQDATLTAK